MKKFTAILLAGVLVFSTLAGCGSSEKDTGTQVPATDSLTDSHVKASESAGDSGGADSEDISHIVVAYPTNGSVPKDLEKIQDAINDITIPEISTEVELFTVEIGSYAQQMNLKTSGGEQVDCMLTFPVGSCNFQTLTSQNVFRPLNALMSQYGSDIQTIVGDKLLQATGYRDDIYGIPCYYDVAESVIWYMRKDILEKYGLTDEAMAVKSFGDMEKVLQKIHDSESGLAPIGHAVLGGQVLTKMDSFYNNGFDSGSYIDRMGDTTLRLGGVDIASDPKTVLNVYASDEYRETIGIIHDWYKKGLVYKDAAISQESPENLMKSGTIFSWLTIGNPTQLASKEVAAGYELVQKEIETLTLNATSLRNFVWGILQSSKEPEASMKFLNMLYSDERIVNLFNLGIENEHYVDNGDDTVSFPEGVDQSNSGYYTFTYWMYGNAFIRKVWSGDDPSVLAQRETVMKETKTSPILGFSFDASGYDLEITALTNVINEYRPGLESGSSDPETELPKFLDALNGAGADVLLRAYQEQLDGWWGGK